MPNRYVVPFTITGTVTTVADHEAHAINRVKKHVHAQKTYSDTDPNAVLIQDEIQIGEVELFLTPHEEAEDMLAEYMQYRDPVIAARMLDHIANDIYAERNADV